MTILELRGITKTYQSNAGVRTPALRTVNLKLESGSFVILVGSNGSGKTTLLNIIAGSEAPDEGQVFLSGTDVTFRPEQRRANLIGRVFQDPYRGTVAAMTVEENLALAACRGHRFDLGFALSVELRREIRERISALGIGLEDRMQQPMATLSGGQRQIVTMLMATWHHPRLLLLDEHTAALDPQSAELVLSLTGHIVETDDLTVLMVTHSMQHAVHFGERLMMMHRGRIVLDLAGTEKLRARPDELVNQFEELRRAELIDESVSALLKEQYV